MRKAHELETSPGHGHLLPLKGADRYIGREAKRALIEKVLITIFWPNRSDFQRLRCRNRQGRTRFRRELSRYPKPVGRWRHTTSLKTFRNRTPGRCSGSIEVYRVLDA